MWWYLKRSYGPINDSGAVTKRGYVMGQFAKYKRLAKVYQIVRDDDIAR